MENKYKILRARPLKQIPCLWNGLSHTSPETKNIHGNCLANEWNYYNGGNMNSAVIENEWNDFGNFIKNKCRSYSKT